MLDKAQALKALQFHKLSVLILLVLFAALVFPIPVSPIHAEKNPYEIIAGVHRNFPPQYSIDENTGKPTGFAIDIMDAVARKAGLKVRYVVFDEWPLIVQAMKAGQIDIIPNDGVIEERKGYVDFTSPVDAFDIHIFVRKTTTDIHSIDDLQGRKVAVVKDNKGLFIIQEYGKAKPLIVNSLDQAFLSLLSGNTDALVYPETPVLLIASKSKLLERIKIVGKPLFEVKRAISVTKGKTDLLNKLDAAVKELIPTREYKEIYAKWYIAPAPFWDVRRVLILAGIILALALIIFVIWHYISLMRLNKDLNNSLNERRHFEEVQAFLAQTSAGSADEPFFERLARFLAQSLSMDFVCIDRLEGDGFNARTVAVWHDGKFEDNVTYALKDTPCGEVVGKTVCCFPASVQQFFPRDQVLQDLRAESYVGVTLWSHSGQPIGLIAVIGHSQLENRQLAETTLKMVAVRAAGELERLDAEEAMHKNRMDLIATIDNLPFLAWMKDREGRFVVVNEQFALSCGLQSTHDLIGKTDLDIWPVKFAESYRADDSEVMRARQKKFVEESIIDQGVEKWFETYKAPLYDVNGNVTGTTGFARDITERKQAEQVVKVANERMDFLLTSTPIVIYSRKTTGDFGATFISENITECLGYQAHEIINTPGSWMKHIHPEDAPRVFTELPSVFEKGYHTIEYRFQQKNGEYRYIHDRLRLVKGDSGHPVEIVGAWIDITERKRAEEENRSLQERLQRSEKMEALGTLAGGVAHDLNNVLGIIVGYSEMLLDGVDKSSPLRHGLENVMLGGLKAAAIVDDLLTLARRGVQGRSILSLNKIIDDCTKSPEFANLSSHHTSVKIITDLETDLLNISGSSVHLSKTLYNLVSNASEATLKGGTVTITTTNQYLDKPIQGYDQIRQGDYVVLSVSDTGEGISANDLKRIFEPFYTKKIMGRSGTGLGLAVVWGTVKDHNGYINVQSEEGKGTTFTLYFPVSREGISTEAAAVAISEYMGNGESILVVDDVKEQRDLAAGILKTLNYNVSSAPSGEEAVAYLKDHEIDLMVLDMIMDPGMDGLDAYKQVLGIRPQQKAIIVSGFSESDRVKAARNLGAGAYLKKPYIKEKLGLAVRKELDRK